MKKFTFLFLLFITSIGFSQVTITPNPFDIAASITISLDASSSATDCNGLNNPTKVYMHSGVGTDADAFNTSVVGNWGLDDGVGEMTLNSSNNLWEITFVPKTYYNLTDVQATSVTAMGIVFRNATGSQELKDNGCKDFIFNVGSFQITLNSPSTTTVLNSGESLSINASASLTASFVLKANGITVNQNSGLTYTYSTIVAQNTIFLLEATNNGETKRCDYRG